MQFVNSETGQAYPTEGMPYRCRDSNGLYELVGVPFFDPCKVEEGKPGIWQYRHMFGLFEGAPLVTLGEGRTPLIWLDYEGLEVGLKLEFLNPTGSYKDRGTAVLVSQMLSRGVREVVEDSSGNAGASLAAYAARANIQARIYVPDYASGPKRKQIELYGAELVCVAGPRATASEAVLMEAEKGTVYASHAFMPFGLPGIATIAYELWDSQKSFPGTVVAPLGHGGLMRALMIGFRALFQQGLIENQPYYVGVQAKACSPLVDAYIADSQFPVDVAVNETMAEGIVIKQPAHGKALLNEVANGKGMFLAVSEKSIEAAYYALANKGLHVEPTSAVVWAALPQMVGNVPEPIVLILTGIGLKYI
jgi:threonine synthase